MPKLRDSAERELRRRINKAFGERVAAARAKLEILQHELGRQLALSRTTISYIECGTQSVTLDQAYCIAKALNVSVTELLPPMDGVFPQAPIHTAVDDPLTPRGVEEVRRVIERVEAKVRSGVEIH